MWTDSYPAGIGEDTAPRLCIKGKLVFALRVEGDSMVGEGN